MKLPVHQMQKVEALIIWFWFINVFPTIWPPDPMMPISEISGDMRQMWHRSLGFGGDRYKK